MKQIIGKYIQVILLDWQENEIEKIEGRCISGSISIDGNSAVRRTCNLSMVTPLNEQISADWGISKKIKVLIKIGETADWINEGLYVITSFSVSESLNSYNVSISAQDKMCLLNGTIGGAIFAETDFGNIDTYKTNADGTVTIEKTELTIFDIIKEAVHSYGHESYENIIIKDIQDALNLLEYRGNSILKKENNQLITLENIPKSDFKELNYGIWYYDKNTGNYSDVQYAYDENHSLDSYCLKINDKYLNLKEMLKELGLIPEDYELLDKQPDDWAENYSNYFIKNSEGTYERLSVLENFEENKYYKSNLEYIDTFLLETIEKYLESTYKHYEREYGTVYTIVAEGGQLSSYKVVRNTPRSKIYAFINKGAEYYQCGDMIGYSLTNLTYSEKDFILKPSETVVALLDKIKNKFGMYEYFYDTEGHFVFQKKATYVNFGYDKLAKNGSIALKDINSDEEYQAYYDDKKEIVTINSSPQIQNIKNDYSIWGTSADKIPFHIRIGINKKPIEYVSYKGIKYSTIEKQSGYEEINDIAEIQWIMNASDLYIDNIFLTGQKIIDLFAEENMTEQLASYYGNFYIKNGSEYTQNSNEFVADQNYYLFNEDKILFNYESMLKTFTKGIMKEDAGLDLETGLQVLATLAITLAFTQQTYKGLAGNGVFKFYRKVYATVDYRELIYQMALDYFAYHTELDFEAVTAYHNPWTKNGKTGYESFYTDMKEFWPKLYSPALNLEQFDDYILSGEYKGWTKDILQPQNLLFWFELVDGNEKYWIENIGSRMKAETNSNITAVAYRDVPPFIFYCSGEGKKMSYLEGYTWINVPDSLKDDFVLRKKSYSAMELVEQYLYSYGNMAETKTISIIPNYNLEPNRKIMLLGEPYVIKRITIPLAYNGIMNLELTKIYND